MAYTKEKSRKFGKSNNLYPYAILTNTDKSDNSKINHGI